MMQDNWIEIKRFLKKSKKNIIVGAFIFSIVFSIALYFLDSSKDKEVQNEEDFDPSPTEIFNNAQPAYFQLYIEYEDGKPYTNFTIINQLFNLPTTKEKVYEATGVDIESVEESMQQEISMNELDEEVKTINVSRNDNSHLYTISFNLGDEGDNLTVARYYYDLIFNKETDFFSNKIPYVFVEPSITKNIKDAENEKELVEEENIQPKASSQGIILGIVINLIIGFLFGGILIIGILLLKELFGKKLNYSFSYDVAENEKFILYDKELRNEDNIAQFIAAPFGKSKVILSEIEMNKFTKNLISRLDNISLSSNSINDCSDSKTILIEKESLVDTSVGLNLSEIIILIYPSHTTRKWFNEQKELADLFDVQIKIIQVNEN